MLKPVPQGMRVGLVQPREAAAAFAARKLLEPSFRWQDVYAEEHTRGFAVAGVLRLDVLQVFQRELDNAINEGTGFAQFSKAVRAQLEAKGFWGKVEVTDPTTGEIRTTTFDQRRLNLIYQTNARQSRAAGLWQRIQRTKDRFPLVMYRTMRDERVRTSHKPWDGLALPVDHAFWQVHFPPNGWNCRCTAFAVDDKMLASYRAKGFEVKTTAPEVQMATFTNKQTGEMRQVPRGIDPGFEYNPGQALLAQAHQVNARALQSAGPELARAEVRATLQGQHFAQWVAKPTPKSAQAVGVVYPTQGARLGAAGPVVSLPAAVARALAAKDTALTALDYLWVQRALDEGAAIAQGAATTAYLLATEGWVVLVRVQRVGAGLVLKDFRRMTVADARADAEVAQLRREGGLT